MSESEEDDSNIFVPIVELHEEDGGDERQGGGGDSASDNEEGQQGEDINEEDGSEHSSFNFYKSFDENSCEQNLSSNTSREYTVVDPSSLDRKSGRKSKYLTAEERTESKRRRDREYRQRKRQQQQQQGEGGGGGKSEVVRKKKMGRRCKYRTPEERIESKRHRDAAYRERLKLKRTSGDDAHAPDAQVKMTPVSNGALLSDGRLAADDDVPAFVHEEKKHVAQEYFEQSQDVESSRPNRRRSSRNKRQTENYEEPSTSSRPVNGRKYFTEEERIYAKRRRDAEYRERLKIRRLTVDGEVDSECFPEHEPEEPIVVQLSEVKRKGRSKMVAAIPNNKMEVKDRSSASHVVCEANSVSVKCDSSRELPNGRKYFTKEERAKGKLQRNAEYRERLKLKKLQEEQEIEQALSFQMSRAESTSNYDETLYLLDFLKKIKRRRQRYYTAEERVAAKRRRDAEYRARQRLKKLQEEREANGEEPLSLFSSPVQLSESKYSESEQGWNHDDRLQDFRDQPEFEPNSSSSRVNESSDHHQAYNFEEYNNEFEEASSTFDGMKEEPQQVKRKRRHKFSSQEERIEAKRRRDAEYRERLKIRKLQEAAEEEQEEVENNNPTSDVIRSHESSYLMTSHDDDVSNEAFRVTAGHEDEVKRKRRRFHSEDERTEAKRKRDAEYRERQRLKKLDAEEIDESSFLEELDESLDPFALVESIPNSADEAFGNYETIEVEFEPAVHVRNRRRRKADEVTTTTLNREERLRAKRLRDAEYMRRKRQLVKQKNPSKKGRIGRRPIYLSESERIEAKRRRDKEYRRRKRMEQSANINENYSSSENEGFAAEEDDDNDVINVEPVFEACYGES